MEKTRVVHCKKEPYDVLIDRTTKWGNPFRIGKGMTREESLRRHKVWLYANPAIMELARIELKGKVLACWCKPEACHGDTLAEVCDAAI